MTFDPTKKCAVDGYAGEMVLLDVAQACGDTNDPRALSFVPVGGSTDTTINIDGETIDVTDSGTIGGFRAFVNSFKTMEISGSGVAKATDGAKSNQTALYKYKAQSSDPYLWVRITAPDVITYAFVNLGTWERTAALGDAAGYSFTMSVRESPHGVLIDDTPRIDEIPVTGVSLDNATMSLTPGETGNLVATVAPSGAQQSLIWTSSDISVATVVNGVVTAHADGTATITAKSVRTPAQTDTCVVTVATA